MGLVAAVVLTAGANSQAGVADKLLLYFPNRIMDLLDIASLTPSFGPQAHLEVWATRAFSFGAGIGASSKLVKAYNRQYGVGMENGWSMSFTCISAENTQVVHTSRDVKEYSYHAVGIPDPFDQVYDFQKGARDYWAIGVRGGGIVELEGELHPIDIADFVLGWFFIDIKGDDFTIDDITY
ncbi:MAG: hypothetical protein A2X49_05705 [Lentisphaerae bacterium GWF2_52_8]|nr:MAG: hypothetical protein A2X49_05705 [Lentisphaerae bacterium GWF2_52_8]